MHDRTISLTAYGYLIPLATYQGYCKQAWETTYKKYLVQVIREDLVCYLGGTSVVLADLVLAYLECIVVPVSPPSAPPAPSPDDMPIPRYRKRKHQPDILPLSRVVHARIMCEAQKKYPKRNQTSVHIDSKEVEKQKQIRREQDEDAMNNRFNRFHCNLHFPVSNHVFTSFEKQQAEKRKWHMVHYDVESSVSMYMSSDIRYGIKAFRGCGYRNVTITESDYSFDHLAIQPKAVPYVFVYWKESNHVDFVVDTQFQQSSYLHVGTAVRGHHEYCISSPDEKDKIDKCFATNECVFYQELGQLFSSWYFDQWQMIVKGE